jgi:colanic acid/amylovoran biosynthesis glycosyltransferase
MNWLYDHLRVVPRYTPLILCDRRVNRDEFPELEDWCPPWSLTRRIWRRLTGSRLYPQERRRLQRRAPCLLHSHFGTVAVHDYRLQRALHVPWVVSFYGADAYEGGLAEKRQRYAPVFERATRVLALGPAMQTRLEQLGCPAEKIGIHPLGVDVAHLPHTPRALKAGETLRLLFAGAIREKKGIQYVVEAAALARQAGVRLELVLVGGTSNKRVDLETKEAVFRRIGQLGLTDVVTHHSFLSFQELIALALRAHIFVAPSVTAANGDAEGTPFVIQQMMATGMPVITTVHSDIPFLFGEHSHLLVPERDAQAIAERIQRYADEPETLSTDGAKLRERVHTFNIHDCAARLSDLYDAVRG